MTPADLERVFGRARLRMVTGEHVEVFREEAMPGERRRYTKRFLCTTEGDFRHWTEREWRILARLVGHGAVAVPEVLRFDRGARGQPSMVQTYDAGVTVDHWTTLLPVRRDRRLLRHVFHDCGHWWALAYHALRALDEIHALQLVHLDLKADNICIPIAPADFDPWVAGQVLRPQFEQLALIDFAFSLVSGEPLAGALPIGHQLDHGYQSPRLLHALEAGRRGDLGPTRQLDWRCDIYSLASMLRRYLPDTVHAATGAWTQRRLAQAHGLVDCLFDVHHRPVHAGRPHRALMDRAASALADAGLADSLARGWELAREATLAHADTPTPVTRIAMPVSMSAHVAGDPIGDMLVRAGPWLRTEPLWAPLRANEQAPPLSATAERPHAASREVKAGRRVPGWAWLPSVFGVAAGALILALPSGLGPVEPIPAMPKTGELSAALVPKQVGHEAAQASPGAEQAGTGTGQGAVSSTANAGTPARVEGQQVAGGAMESPQEAVLPPRDAAAPGAASAPTETRSAATDGRRPAARTPRVHAHAQGGDGHRSVARTLKPGRATAAASPSSSVAPVQPPKWAAAPKATVRREALRNEGTTRVARASSAGASAVRAPSAPTRVVAAPRLPAVPRAAGPTEADKPADVVSAAGTRAPEAGQEGGLKGVDTPEAIVSSAPAAPELAQAAPSVLAAGAPAVLEDFTERAQALITGQLPRLAQRAERLVLRVLHAASIAPAPGGPDAQVLNAAQTMQRVLDDALAAWSAASEDARRLHEAAAAAFWGSRDPARALRLELRAFGADPRDPEVAGALAFYQLKQRPVQAEAARRLALLALALPQPGSPHGRIEDWTTFAIASALAGRERDARNAWLVTLSLGPVERQCRAAVAAYASHGAALRTSVEAMLASLREAGRSDESPFCRWPPNWWAGLKR